MADENTAKKAPHAKAAQAETTTWKEVVLEISKTSLKLFSAGLIMGLGSSTGASLHRAILNGKRTPASVVPIRKI